MNHPLLEPIEVDEDVPMSPNDTVILVELYRLNGKSFHYKITDEEIKEIWTILGRRLSELKSIGQRIIPGRALRITYKLKSALSYTEISSTPDVYITVDRSGQKLNYEARFLSFGKEEQAEPGDVVRLTILSAYPEVSFGKIESWLALFGTIREPLSVAIDKDGIEVGNVTCKFQIKHHLPEHLPIYGVKARLYYVGQPKQCSFCYKLGHVKKDCNYEKTSWTQYIIRLRKTGHYTDSMFGNWVNTIDGKKRRRSPPPFDEPKEDRYEKRRYARPSNDLREKLRTKDARGRIENKHYLGRYRGRSPRYQERTPYKHHQRSSRQNYSESPRYDRASRRSFYHEPRENYFDEPRYRPSRRRYDESPMDDDYEYESPRRTSQKTPEPRVRSVVVQPDTKKRDRSPSSDIEFFTPKGAKRRQGDDNNYKTPRR